MDDQGLCGDCREHAVNEVTEEVSAVIIDHEADSVARIMFTVMYDDDDMTIDEAVQDRIETKYADRKIVYTYNYDDEIEIEDLDYRD